MSHDRVVEYLQSEFIYIGMGIEKVIEATGAVKVVECRQKLVRFFLSYRADTLFPGIELDDAIAPTLYLQGDRHDTVVSQPVLFLELFHHFHGFVRTVFSQNGVDVGCVTTSSIIVIFAISSQPGENRHEFDLLFDLRIDFLSPCIGIEDDQN